MTINNICKFPIKLSSLKAGQKAVITGLSSEDLELSNRLAVLGLVPGHDIEVTGQYWFHDLRVKVLDYQLALRSCEAAAVFVEPIASNQ